MKILEIYKEDAPLFSEYIDEDMRENLDRVFYNAIGAMDEGETPAGILVYELQNSESEKDTLSRILSFDAKSGDISDELMSEYEEAVAENEVAYSFYESPDERFARGLSECGFSLEKAESPDIVLSLRDVRKLCNIVKTDVIPPYIMPLSEVSVFQYRTFVKECLFRDNRGLAEDLAYLPQSWFDQELSSCMMDDEELKGALLIRRNPSGLLQVMLYTAIGADFRKNLALMMMHSARMVVKHCPEDTGIIIRRHNDGVKKLTDKLFSSAKGEIVLKGKRQE